VLVYEALGFILRLRLEPWLEFVLASCGSVRVEVEIGSGFVSRF